MKKLKLLKILIFGEFSILPEPHVKNLKQYNHFKQKQKSK